MASRPVRFCLRCAEAESDSELFTLYHTGRLEVVCARCFYLAKIASLTSQLAPNDVNRLVVQASLRQIYEWLEDRLDERRSQELGRGIHDAAQD